jgi:tetratricopeptide (TPR) repeat protein
MIFSFLIPSLVWLAGQDLLPERTPTSAQREIIADGIRLHDQGKFAEAIGRYRKVLEENPESGLAWYELAYSQTMLKQWKECIVSTREGLKYESPQRPGLLMELASCLDSSGDGPAAIGVFQQALKELPASAPAAQRAMIHFNFGVTYHGLKDFAKAKQQLQQSLTLNPRHASSHLQLARIYAADGDSIPALLAYGLFLSLEPPTSARVPDAVTRVQQILGAGVEQTGPKKVNIQVALGKFESPEGDFGPELMLLGLLGAADLMGDGKKKKSSEFGRLESRWSTLISTLVREDRRQKLAGTFVGRNYLEFYRGLEEQKLLGAFVSHAYQSVRLAESKEEKAALSKMDQYLLWVKSWGVR